MVDGSHAIVDYKTSKYTAGQSGLINGYRVQLNAYAYIGQRLDLAPISLLALVYMEPITDEGTAKSPHLVDEVGFSMGLGATVVPVEVRPDELIPPLLRKALAISDMDSPPSASPGCKDCEAVAPLVQALR